MSKENCWQIKKCGREPGGASEKEPGVCPASVNIYADGINGGRNGGRACWALAGTMCGGGIQGTYAVKYGNCSRCDFFQQVKAEEGRDYKGTEDIKCVIRNRMSRR